MIKMFIILELGDWNWLKEFMGFRYFKLVQLLLIESGLRQLRFNIYIWIVLKFNKFRSIVCVKGVYVDVYVNLFFEIKYNKIIISSYYFWVFKLFNFFCFNLVKYLFQFIFIR